MSEVNIDKVSLYRVTWPGYDDKWAEQRIVALDGVDKHKFVYRLPKWTEVDYDQRHVIEARQSLGFGTGDRMSHADARLRGVFETPEEAKRWVWECLQVLTTLPRNERGYVIPNRLPREKRKYLRVANPWPMDSTASLSAFAAVVDALPIRGGK